MWIGAGRICVIEFDFIFLRVGVLMIIMLIFPAELSSKHLFSEYLFIIIVGLSGKLELEQTGTV